jgi:predicted ATPase
MDVSRSRRCRSHEITFQVTQTGPTVRQTVGEAMTEEKDPVVYGFGAWLRRWREEQHWTQEQLAKKLGFGTTYVRKLESGARPPTAAVLARAGVVSGLRPEAMVGVPVRKGPLPRPKTSLIGRDAEAEKVAAALSASPGAWTLIGPAGVGKTRLAIAAASRVRGLEHGVWWVPLVEVTDARAVPARIVEVLGLSQHGHRPPTERLVEYLRGQEGVLVLDNFEHVLAAAPLVVRLVDEAPRMRVLTTSREALGIQGEIPFSVLPLPPCINPAGVALATIRESPAVSLFLDRARHAIPTPSLREQDLPVIAAICDLVDGIPLAIELAAANSGAIAVADIASSLRVSLDVLGNGPSDVASHHRTLAAAIDWSYQLLAPELQRLLSGLSVFNGGSTPLAAASVIQTGSDGDDAPVTVQTAMLALARKNLLVARPDAASGTRFEMLHVVRAFASERLQQQRGRAELGQRHCEYFTQLAEEARPGLVRDEQAHWLAVIDDERANFDDAVEWALEHHPPSALAIVGCLWRAYWLRGWLSTWRRRIDAALEATSDSGAPRARALNGAIVLGITQGDYDQAWLLCDVAEQAGLSAGQPEEVALTVLNRGIIHENRNEFDAAGACFERALGAYESLGDDRGRAHCINCQGMVLLDRDDDLDGGEKLFRRSLGLLGKDDHYGRALFAGNLGWVAWRKGRLSTAQAWYEESLERAEAINDERGVANRLSDLSLLALDRGEKHEAARLAVDAVARFQRIGDRRGGAECLERVGAIAVALGDPGLAVRLLGRSDALRDEIGSPLPPADRPAYDAVVAAARSQLGDDLDDLKSAGGAMTFEQAVACARSALTPAPGADS